MTYNGTPCTETTLRRGRYGYARRTFNGVEMNAHRAAFIEAYGYVPVGLDVDHLCRNPSCVNPEHLEAVTHAENVRRQWRDTMLCRRGLHDRVPENRIIRVWSGKEVSICRPCHEANEARKLPARRQRRALQRAELAS